MSKPKIKDVSDFLDAGGDVEDLDRLAQVTPEWVPTLVPREPTEKLDEPAATKLKSDIFAAMNTARSVQLTLCKLLATFADHGGFEILGLVHTDSFGRVHRAYSYFAVPWNVTPRRVRQMIEDGRLLEQNEACFAHLPPEQITGRHVAAFRPLADEPEKLEIACLRAKELADEAAKLRARAAEEKGKPLAHPPKSRVTTRLCTAAVEEIAPRAKRSPSPAKTSTRSADAQILARFRRDVERWMDVLGLMSGTAALRQSLHNADRLAKALRSSA